MLDEQGLDAWIEEHFTRSAFRLETLDRYTVDSDQGNVERYLTGQPGPSWAEGGDWFDQLAAERAAGKRRYRVRVWTSPIGPYLRYEAEWGYLYTSKAGEEIYVLDLAETARPSGLLEEDFFVIDDRRVLRMHYDDQGRLLGGEPLPEDAAEPYLRCRDAAMAAAVPFQDWWNRHPEVRRDQAP